MKLIMSWEYIMKCIYDNPGISISDVNRILQIKHNAGYSYVHILNILKVLKSFGFIIDKKKCHKAELHTTVKGNSMVQTINIQMKLLDMGL